jgi:outer membrane autotransporter protein
MTTHWTSGRPGKAALLATSSLVSLVALGTAQGQAACYTGPFAGGSTNAVALSCINVINTSFTGNLVNTGTISPGGINLTNSTITGAISDSGFVSSAGVIAGGINVDANSKIAAISRNAIQVDNTVTFGGGISNAGTISSVNARGIFANFVSTFTGGITNTGSLSGGSSPAIELNSLGSFAGGIFNGGTLSSHSSSGISVRSVSAFSGGITNISTITSPRTGIAVHAVSTFSGGISNGGTISTPNSAGIVVDTVSIFTGGISNSKVITSCGNGIRVANVQMFSDGISNGGTITVASANAIDISNVTTFQGGIVNTGTVSGRFGIFLSSAPNVSIFDSGTISSTIVNGTAIQFGGGVNTLTLGPGFSITGKVVGAGTDIFQLGGAGSGFFNLSAIGASNQYQGFTTFNVLSGTFGQTNPWTVQGGKLLLNGDLSGASSITVNSGGTLGGGGIAPTTTILNGGTLAPGGGIIPAALPAVGAEKAVGSLLASGNALTIRGNLVMQSAAMYLVQVSPTSASRTNVSGTASVGGQVIANGTGGTYTLGTKYTVLTATGGVSGTFSLATTTGNFGQPIRPVISYDANDVFLTLDAATVTSLLPPGATVNVRNLAGGLDSFILGGGTLPPGFLNIFSFSPQQIQNALNQLTGEVGTGAQQSAFQLMTEFMDLLFGAPGGAGGGGAMGFAPEREALPPDVALAYASVLKAPPAKPAISTWASAYGGANKTNGDPTVIGSSDLSARTFGVAVGLDYQVAADTKVGFALAGAGTGWSLSGGLGSGNSNAIQAAIYGTRQFGPAYISGALASATYQVTTNRTLSGPALPADQLSANFAAQSLGGRLEGGYRIPASMAFGVIPYAAVQVQSFWTPSYGESGQLGPPDPFALTFASRHATATRTELGSRFDRVVPTTDGTLGLFGRLAWAHDAQDNLSITPAFLGLPTPAFVINGAAPPRDKALVTGGAEWRMRGGWSLMGKFDGELANGSVTYTGTGQVKYTW